ncbi:MAG: polyphosphate kinase 2 family protein [Candidatus Eiseniibacteriota bacterium]
MKKRPGRMHLAEQYRVDDGGRFRLKRIDPRETSGLEEDEFDGLLEKGVERLADLQAKLHAQNCWSVLLIFQAMDAAGKDGTIKHVLSGVNPQGVEVHAFKAPSTEELDHDFLWRCAKRLPERGRIGIFNRSYYEETLIVRVHPPILAKQKLPPKVVTKRIWDERFEDIRNFERYLTRNGTLIRKFFLHVSKAEQRRRFLARIEEPEKHWKFSPADVAERAHWKEYRNAYEETIRETSTPWAPWYVVPADNKWFTRLVVADAIVDALESLKLEFPTLDPAARRALAQAKRDLLAEDGKRGSKRAARAGAKRASKPGR